MPAAREHWLDPLTDQTVISADGEPLSESEWASRGKQDSLYDGEKMTSPSPSPEVIAAAEAHSKAGRDLEDADKAVEEISSKQIEHDTADSIDSPGQSAGGTLIVREGEESLEDVSLRRDAEKSDAESERVLAARADADALKALEEGSLEIELPDDDDEGDEAEQPDAE